MRHALRGYLDFAAIWRKDKGNSFLQRQLRRYMDKDEGSAEVSVTWIQKYDREN
jgi:hypothetical protein